MKLKKYESYENPDSDAQYNHFSHSQQRKFIVKSTLMSVTYVKCLTFDIESINVTIMLEKKGFTWSDAYTSISILDIFCFVHSAIHISPVVLSAMYACANVPIKHYFYILV